MWHDSPRRRCGFHLNRDEPPLVALKAVAAWRAKSRASFRPSVASLGGGGRSSASLVVTRPRESSGVGEHRLAAAGIRVVHGRPGLDSR
jgi:hypothetical protein